jgi:hypothetical protein
MYKIDWSKLVSTRRSTVLSIPLQLVVPALVYYQAGHQINLTPQISLDFQSFTKTYTKNVFYT